MLRRIGKVFVVAALVLTTGLHWAMLQTVAWTTMLADNLCKQSLTEAVSQTFDGQHLCPLCRAIAAGKKAEQNSKAVVSKLKMEYPPVAEKFALIVAPTPVSALSLDGLSARSSFLKPPSPPPRGFFV
ncbi:MAG TPA: hypothetical protein VNX46_18780 [Candidatus Acidoferrum sp.]|nr:hypothetical protein [Candidatus Acidoferrum sp.]